MNFQYSLFVATLAIIAQVLAAGVVPEFSLEEGDLERIVRGRNAKPGQFPWAAALFYNDEYICSGSILSPNTYLTAAHCVVFEGESQSPSLFHAIANVNKSASSYLINFREVIVHPGYISDSLDDDIAVLKTSQPIPFTDTVQPVCIAGPNTAMNQYKSATAMGWGSTSPIILLPRIPDNLQYGEQKIVKNRLCSWVNSGVNENKICAQGLLNGICTGDSGGPLVHMRAANPPVQIGIASYINGVVGSVFPAVWTRVSSYYDFIMQASDDNMICSFQ